MDWNQVFQIKNVSEMNLISGIVTIAHGDKMVIDPEKASEAFMKDIKTFYNRDYLEVTNDVKIQAKKSINKESNVKVIDLESSEKRTSAITVNPIDTSGPIIQTTNLLEEMASESKPAAKEDKRMTKEEAVELLGQHWKKFEAEVNKIDDARKLNFLQIVATEIGVTGKKLEIIEARLNEI